jgi:hypothetical protein
MGGPGGGGAGPEFGPNDGGRPPGMGRPGGYPAPGMGGPYPYPGGNPEEGEFPGMGPGVQTNPNFPIPQGEFDPQEWITKNVANAAANAANGVPPGTIVCWAHDDSAEPGHTYRYRVTYTMKNPIFQMPKFAKNAKLTGTFGMDSKPSEWSEPVEMLSTIAFWVARGPSGQAVAVQVFRWRSGETKSKEYKLGPGDAVGAKDGETDFGTGWTVVDIVAPANAEWYVLLMDPAGNLHRRDKTDIGDAKFQKMKEQAAASSAAAATPSPGPPIAGAAAGH